MILNLLAAGYGRVSDIEIAWTILALLGMIFSSYNLKEAQKDYIAIKVAGVGNGRRILAKNARRVEVVRVIIQSIFLLIGIAAMTLPEPNEMALSWHYRIVSAIFRWGIISASALTTLKAYWGYDTRRRLKEEYGNFEETHAEHILGTTSDDTKASS